MWISILLLSETLEKSAQTNGLHTMRPAVLTRAFWLSLTGYNEHQRTNCTQQGWVWVASSGNLLLPSPKADIYVFVIFYGEDSWMFEPGFSFSYKMILLAINRERLSRAHYKVLTQRPTDPSSFACVYAEMGLPWGSKGQSGMSAFLNPGRV